MSDFSFKRFVWEMAKHSSYFPNHIWKSGHLSTPEKFVSALTAARSWRSGSPYRNSFLESLSNEMLLIEAIDKFNKVDNDIYDFLLNVESYVILKGGYYNKNLLSDVRFEAKKFLSTHSFLSLSQNNYDHADFTDESCGLKTQQAVYIEESGILEKIETFYKKKTSVIDTNKIRQPHLRAILEICQSEETLLFFLKSFSDEFERGKWSKEIIGIPRTLDYFKNKGIDPTNALTIARWFRNVHLGCEDSENSQETQVDS